MKCKNKYGAQYLDLVWAYRLVLVNWNMEGEEVGKGTNKREAQGTRLVPVLWHQMSVTNTSAARTFVAGTITAMWHAVARTVVADSYVHPRQAITRPMLPAFRKYLRRPNLPELHRTNRKLGATVIRRFVASLNGILLGRSHHVGWHGRVHDIREILRLVNKYGDYCWGKARVLRMIVDY
jgi:hypothetical protein